ncbi:MAG: AmmeMemoRadiSam system protein A [Phycisphaerae bacterium]
MPADSPTSSDIVCACRAVIEAAVARDPLRREAPGLIADRPHGGVFVTLWKAGRLRGCMGTLDASLPLAEALRDAALSAATRDPRFPPVAPDELAELKIEVSVLSAPQAMRSIDDLVIGRHGVLVRRGSRRGLFLPKVATDHHLSREEFLERCCTEKAGLPPDAWRDGQTEVLLFTAEVLSEA